MAQVVFEVAAHVLLVDAQLRLHGVNGGEIVLEQRQPATHHVQILSSQAVGHTQGTLQFEPNALPFVQRLQNEALQRREAAGQPQRVTLVLRHRLFGP